METELVTSPKMADNDIKELELEELYSQAKDRFVGIPTGEDA